MNALRSSTRLILNAQRLTSVNYTGSRFVARWIAPTMRELVKRKIKAGPEPEQVRSDFLEWNQDAELYAFNVRLSEKFDLELLLQALTFRSYLVDEEQKQRAVGIENPKLDILENSEFIEDGQKLTEKIIKAYLCKALPRAPEECIYALLDYLMTQELIAQAALNIGTKDLILTADRPISEETLACTFFAVVSALSKSPEVDLAHVGNFVRDFLIAVLAEKDLTEIWCPTNAENILNDILARENREIAEPRLIGQTGVSTFLAAYQVGFYSDKQLIGKSFGETVDEARTAAAIDALYRMFGLGDSSKPIKYNLTVDISSDVRTENLPITHWCNENLEKIMRT